MKRTIFEGTVNGEKFNTVQEYNARLTELINSGVAVNASSNTRVEEVDEPAPASGFVRTCTDEVCDGGKCTFTSTYDEDLSYYPYFENDDPYYLDILVTNKHDVNVDARKEAQIIFDKCYPYICESLHDNDITIETKKDYLQDVRDLITKIKQDSKFNAEAIVSVRQQREEAERKYKDATIDYEDTIRRLDQEEALLHDARPVIDDFTQFYSAIESEALQSIAEQTAYTRSNKENCSNTNENNKCRCTCGSTEPIATASIKETMPQHLYDFQTLINKVFGPGRLF